MTARFRSNLEKNMPRTLLSAILILSLAFIAIGCETDPGQNDDPVSDTNRAMSLEKGGKAEPSPAAGSDAHAGPQGPGGEDGIILPNGRLIKPASNTGSIRGLRSPAFPMTSVVDPTGEWMYFLSLRDRMVVPVNVATWTLGPETNADNFNGLVMNADGSKLWVAGGGHQEVYEYEVDGPTLTKTWELRVQGFPSGMALSPDEQTLYVASNYGHRVAFVDLNSGLEVGEGVCQVYPYAVVVTADGSTLFVSNWGGKSVSVIDADTGENLDNIPVGKNPEGMAFSTDGSKLFVANSDSDTVSVIDTDLLEVVSTIAMTDEPETKGAIPTEVYLHEGKIWVTCSGLNAIAILDEDTEQIEGFIPTGWYPTAVSFNPVTSEVYVSNGKGEGTDPDVAKAIYQQGSLNKFDDDFTPTELSDWTDEVTANNLRTSEFYAGQTFDSPIPTEIGVASTQIKRVIFVMKENKTFDVVLGDLKDVEGEPSFADFGEEITPNAHALARQFSHGDNFYSQAENSLQGHIWGTASICPDYVEKRDFSNDAQALSGVEPAAIPEREFIFQHILNNGLTFRSYGQVVGTITDMDRLAPYVSLKFGFYNQGVSDETKIEEVIRDMEAGIWPPFVYISLPNDHTEGNTLGAPTMDWMVADNDAGMGKLVDYVSHSEFWDETVIFVTEDDPQTGRDHIDPHRTIGLVISPWAKRNYVSHVFYSMDSMWATFMRILGLPPLSQYDQFAAPMYDCFTLEPDTTPYNAIPNPIPFEVNEKGLPMQAYCNAQDWSVPDQAERLGEVTWKTKHPGQPYPFPYTLDPLILEEEEEEEADEVAEYKQMLKAWTEYAEKKGVTPLKGNLHELRDKLLADLND
jgi:YVTN family beta-propeller protein